MNILIVNNGTRHIEAIRAACKPHQTIVVPYHNLSFFNVEDCNACILSGGKPFAVVGHRGRLQPEIDFILNLHIPLLGICFGFELMMYAYGAILEKMATRIEGTINVVPTVDSVLFQSPLQAYANHRYKISSVPPEFEVIAKSGDIIEAVRHKNKPLYGVQFHPEVITDDFDNTASISAFLNLS